MFQLEQLEEKILDLHNTILNSKSIPNNKLFKENIHQQQSKVLELQDVNITINQEVERLTKVELASVPSSEANDSHIIEQEGLLSETTNEAKDLQ